MEQAGSRGDVLIYIQRSPIQTSAGKTTILIEIFVDFHQSLKVHVGRADNEHNFYILFNSLLILQYHLIRCKRKVTQPILKYLLKAVTEPILPDS
jgi:hypothetical protein